jgi:elongator complex protein 3
MINLLAEIKGLLPPYVRVSRLMRDIPTKFILAGSQDLALRETVRKRMEARGLRCRCIRCREYGHRLRRGWSMGEFRLIRRDYRTEGGEEIFLTYEDENETLSGLLRLRIKDGVGSEERAVVRELHVFGPEVPLGGKQKQAVQHRGWGSRLLGEAERIAREEFHAGKLSVLSGVGAREYYRLSGYELQGNYMTKGLGVDV